MTNKILTNRQAIGVLDGLWSNPLFGETHRQAFEIGIRAIKALEYDDAKYHADHGEVVVDKAVWEDAERALEQEPCEDAISRQEAYKCLEFNGEYDTLNEVYERLQKLPSVKQESSITWVTGADGAKIAFWNVPVWKVTKICEILGKPQESEVNNG